MFLLQELKHCTVIFLFLHLNNNRKRQIIDTNKFHISLSGWQHPVEVGCVAFVSKYLPIASRQCILHLPFSILNAETHRPVRTAQIGHNLWGKRKVFYRHKRFNISFGSIKLQTAASRVLNVFHSEINKKEILNVTFVYSLEHSLAREKFKKWAEYAKYT